jgi:hypothetical protein
MTPAPEGMVREGALGVLVLLPSLRVCVQKSSSQDW